VISVLSHDRIKKGKPCGLNVGCRKLFADSLMLTSCTVFVNRKRGVAKKKCSKLKLLYILHDAEMSIPLFSIETRGVQSSGMPGEIAWLYVHLKNCSIEECDKYGPLKYVKPSVDKKQISNNWIKSILNVFFVFEALLFNNLFYSVVLRHLFISKIFPVMVRHWGIWYCIYSCKYVSYRPTKIR